MRKLSTSIIVPVFEQWRLVPELVGAIRRQSVPPDEVIFVDNGSTSVAVPKHIPFAHRVLGCHTPGSYAARNCGARHAAGRVLVFTDADCVPERDWLAGLLAALGEAEDRIVAGHVEVSPGSSPPNAYEIYDMLRGIQQQRYVARGYAATANLALSRSLFDSVGGFDGRRKSGGDADLCRRAVAAGATLLFVREAVVRHPARSTWFELETKARRLKGGQVRHQTSRRGVLVMIAKTLLRPLREVSRLLAERHWPLHYRISAFRVAIRLWGVELREMFRLWRGAPEERR